MIISTVEAAFNFGLLSVATDIGWFLEMSSRDLMHNM